MRSVAVLKRLPSMLKVDDSALGPFLAMNSIW